LIGESLDKPLETNNSEFHASNDPHATNDALQGIIDGSIQMSKFDESEMSYYRTHKVKQHYTMNHKNLYLNDGKEPIYRYKGL
jgi:hypothetical protein